MIKTIKGTISINSGFWYLIYSKDLKFQGIEVKSIGVTEKSLPLLLSQVHVKSNLVYIIEVNHYVYLQGSICSPPKQKKMHHDHEHQFGDS